MTMRYPGLENAIRDWCRRYQRFPERTPYHE